MRKSLLLALSIASIVSLATVANAQIITTFAGTGTAGYNGDGVPATAAQLNTPYGVGLDSLGNIYIGDALNNRIRKVNTSGIITTIAGNGTAGFSGDGGPATAAELNEPIGMAVDRGGDVFIADRNNNRIREIKGQESGGDILTIGGNGTQGFSGDGGLAVNAELYFPQGIFWDNLGNVYFGDQYNNRIRKISPDGIIITVAGNGVAASTGDGGAATAASLNYPCGVAVDPAGNIYISEEFGYRIRKVNASGIISTVAGNGTMGYSGDGGPATNAQLNAPKDVFLDAAGNIYIGDGDNQVIRMVDALGTINTIAGTHVAGYSGDGGAATAAKLYEPQGVFVDPSGDIFIGDCLNHRIREITCTLPNTGTIAGTDTVCAGETLSLSDAVTGGTWSSSNTAVGAVSTSGVVNGITSGTVVISYVVTNGCGTATTAVAVSVNPAPAAGSIAGTDTVCAGETLSLSDSAAGGVWSSSNSSLATISSSGTVTGIATGAVTLSYTVTNACGIANATLPVAVFPAGYCDASVKTVAGITGITVFPNPNAGAFTMNVAAGYDDKVQVCITNILGEKIKEQTTTTNKTTDLQINAPAGIYFLTATSKNSTEVVKIVIE